MDLEVGIKVEDLFKKFCKESKNQKTALNLKMDKKKRGLKHILYKAINSFGYKISNKKRERKTIENELAKYGVHSHYSLLLHSSQYVFALQKIFPDLRISDYEDRLRVSFQNLVFFVESKEEFLILKEIFIDLDYHFIDSKDCIIIDIGANVGMTSIFFSQFDFIKKIYAFEPVLDTFEIARKNLKENKFSEKVLLKNFGLGKKEREETFLFSRRAKGNSGIRGKLSPSYEKGTGTEKRTVKIKNASSVLTPILAENKKYKIVMKMDCEGAEYEILESLNDAEILSKIDVIMLEWHDYGALKIEKYLKDNNFIIFSRNLGPISGMIYAVR